MIRRSILAVAALASAAQAQEPRDTVTLAPVTVTATRVPVDARTTPASVTVITGEELRARGITRIADALRDVPGASVVQSGSFGAQTGLFLRGGESDYTKVLIDGVPVNDAGGSIDLAHLAVADVERIEILRGPGSVLWGSDAVTGVIQIFTRRAVDRLMVDASARAGGYGTRDATAVLGIARGRTSVSASGSASHTDGILDFNNGYRNEQAGVSFSVRPRDRADVRASLRHSDATYHYPTDFLGNVVDRNQYRRETRLVASVDAAVPVASRVTARVTAGFSGLDAISDNQVDRPDDFAYHDESEAERRVLDGRIDVRLPRDITLTTGAEWTGEHERNTANFDASRLNRGYYAQLLAGGTDTWAVALGARLDDNEKFGTFLTSRASASLRVAPGTRVRAAWGTAFKEPAFAEVFNTSFTRGNPTLSPERSRSMEASLEQELFAGRARATATWFAQRFRDRVDFLAFPPDSAVFGTFDNIGRAIADGLEVELRVRAFANVALAASYAYLETEITEDEFNREGQRLLRRPAHTATATASYTRERGSLFATVQRIGSRHDVGYVKLPWYTVVDLGGEYGVVQRPSFDVTLTARVENALDEEYEAVVGYPAPGLRALFGAAVRVK
jgi:vitamin B12 transporter